jgi:hypothetical protein
VSAGEYRRADDGGEPRIDQDLPAYDDEAAIWFGIISRTVVSRPIVCRTIFSLTIGRRTAGLMNAIDFASSHVLIFTSFNFFTFYFCCPGFRRRLCVRVLIAKNVLHFYI